MESCNNIACVSHCSVHAARLAPGGIAALARAALAVELAAGARSSARPAITPTGTAPRALPRSAIDSACLHVAAADTAQPRTPGAPCVAPRVRRVMVFVVWVFALRCSRNKERSIPFLVSRTPSSVRTKPKIGFCARILFLHENRRASDDGRW